MIGIGAWLIAGMTGGPTASTSGSGSPAIIGAGNVSVGPTTPTPHAVTPAPPSALPTTGSAKTLGDQSPAIIGGGNVTVVPGAAPSQAR